MRGMTTVHDADGAPCRVAAASACSLAKMTRDPNPVGPLVLLTYLPKVWLGGAGDQGSTPL